MSVRRVQDRYSSDAGLKQKDIDYWMSVICDNDDLVPQGRRDFIARVEALLEDGRPLQDWEVSEIEHVYETVCAAAGLPAVKKHQDRRRKGLRYG